MRSSLRVLAALLGLLACLPALPQDGDWPLTDSAPKEGERLVYDVRWGPFEAGRAVLDVWHVDPPGEGQHYALELRATTSGLFSRVYPLEVRIRSLLSGNLSRTLDFHKLQNGRETRIAFDWQERTAQTIREDEVLPPVELPAWALDPLGLVMYLRRQPLEPGQRVEAWFTDGKRLTAGKAGVIAEEALETAAGAFSTLVVQPDLQGVGGEFAKSRNPRMKVWFSDDARRLPVRVTSKLRLGHLVGELVAVQALSAPADPAALAYAEEGRRP